MMAQIDDTAAAVKKRPVDEQAAGAVTWARPLVVLSDVVERITEGCYVAFTAAFAAIMLLGIVFRYGFNNSLAWSDELALILYVWATFLAISLGYIHDQHVRIDLVIRSLPPVWRVRVAVVVEGLAGAYLVCLLVSSIVALRLVARGHTDALQWPLTVPYLAIPVATALMLIYWTRRNAVAATPSASLVKLLVIVGFFWVVFLPLGQYVQLGGPPRFWLLAITFAAPLLFGVPVAFALGLVSMMYVAVFGTIPFSTGALQIFYGTEVLALMAVPLLMLSGFLLHTAGVARRLVDFAQVLVGRMRGGLGATNVVASLIFADITGSTVSDTAAIGSLMIPEMKHRGYQAPFCAALQGAAGTLGIMFPPAITLLLYAIAVEVSVSRLFAASIVPGFLVALSFMLVTYVHARRHGYPREHVPRHLIVPRILGALPGMFAGVIVVGGILGGVFTPAEAGTVLLAYVLLLVVVVYRSVGPRQLYRVTVEAGYISGMTLFLAATSTFLGFVLARDLLSFLITDVISQLTTDKLAVIFLVNIVFIILGMILEAPALIFGFMPSFMPLLQQTGIDPVHWGVLFAINMSLGMLVPPIALNLFISTAIAGVRYEQAVRAAVPFIFILTVDLVLVALYPQIALFVPHVLFGYPLK